MSWKNEAKKNKKRKKEKKTMREPENNELEK